MASVWLAKNPPKIENYDVYTVRVTYYWGHKETATGAKPVCGKTAAVDPKIIPYGSRIRIPEMDGMTFIAQDTGPAVVKKTASKMLGKDNLVVDIFCKDKYIAQKRIKDYPMFMKIKVYKNS